MQINNLRAAEGRPVGRAVAPQPPEGKQPDEDRLSQSEKEQPDEDRPKPPVARAGRKAQPATRSMRIPWHYGAALLLFGVPFWPVSAWYLASGWIEIINGVLDFLRISAALPALSGWIGLGVAILVGAIYSRVELSPPLRGYPWRTVVLLWLAWAVVMLSDVGATYRGLDRGSVLGISLALALTFAPDQAIMRGWRILRGRPPF